MKLHVLYRKFGLLIFLVAISLTAHSQWQKIGWEHAPMPYLRQNGNVLYSSDSHTIYRSTDDGDTWEDIGFNLPQTFCSFTNQLAIINFIGDAVVVRDLSYKKLPDLYKQGVDILPKDSTYWKFYNDSEYQNTFKKAEVRIDSDSILKLIDSVLYFSSDGGNTWVNRMPIISGTPIPDISYFMVRHGRIFTELSNLGGLYASDDYGKTWLPKAGGLPDSISSAKLSYNLNSALIYKIVTENWPELYISTDEAESWRKITGLSSGYLTDVYWIKELHDKIFLNLKYLKNIRTTFCTYFSSDSGNTWQQAIIIDSSKYIADIAEHSQHKGFIVTVANNPIPYFWVNSAFEIIDTPLFTGSYLTNSVLSYVNDHKLFALKSIYSLGLGTDTLYKSYDEGLTWQPEGFPGKYTLDRIPWLNGDKYIYASGTDSLGFMAIFRSPDEGSSWETVLNNDSLVNCKYFRNKGDTLTITAETKTTFERRLLLSYDAGSTWKLVPVPVDNFDLLCYSSGMLYGIRNFGNADEHPLYYCSAESFMWGQLRVPLRITPDTTIDRLFVLKDQLFVSALVKMEGTGFDRYFPVLFSSTNSGFTWTRCDDGLKPEGYIMDIKANGNMIFLLSCGAIEKSNLDGKTHVFYSTNKGSSWQKMKGSVPEAYDLFLTDEKAYLSSPTGGFYTQSLPSPYQKRDPRYTERNDISIDFLSNPASDGVSIQLTTITSQPIEIRLYDALSRLLQTHSFSPVKPGKSIEYIGTRHLAAGAYYVQASNGISTVTKLLQIQK